MCIHIEWNYLPTKSLKIASLCQVLYKPPPDPLNLRSIYVYFI